MHYVPGFTNYLQVSVPRYANGGAIMDDPRQAAVMPMTQEAAPFDLSSLAGLDLSGLYGMNFGSDFGGGAMGGIYPDDPNTEYIGAPVSNKGNFTAQSGNAFVMGADQPVRLVDLNTNTVIFEGTGYDAAREATRLGQNLSDTMGRKAQYNIQTANPAGEYTTVANEKKNKSTLGEIANVAGTALPLALLAIPGAGPALFGMTSGAFAASLPAQLAFGALTGAASSGLKGQNVLKGAALGGLTAAGGALIPKIPAVGDLGKLAKPLGVGIGSTVGNLATGQNLKNSLLSGAASGALAYAAPGIQDALRGTQVPNVGSNAANAANAANVGSGPAPIATVTGNTSFAAPVNIGAGSSSPTKLAELEPPATIVSGSGAPFAASFPIPASVLSGALPSTLQQPKTEIPTDEEMKEILVRASYLSPDALAALMYKFGGASPSAEQPKPNQMSEEDQILVKARPSFTPSLGIGDPASLLTDAELQEILVKARPSFTSPLDINLPTTGIGDPNSLLTDAELQEILVKGRPAFTPPVNLNLPTTGIGDPNSLLTDAELQEILVKGRETLTPPIGIGAPTNLLPDNFFDPASTDVNKKLTAKELADYLRLAGLASSLLGGLGGGDKGGGSGGRIPAGMGGLSSLFSKQLPPSTLLGGAGGGALPASTLAAQGFNSPQNYYRYGYGPEQSFFDYATQGAPNTSRAYTGYEGSTAEDAFAPQPVRLPPVTLPQGALPQVALPQPITTPVPNNPAAPSMYLPDTTRFARGGFAVEGAGDGRDDKIPALLSDGEYVFDAETVALLGNGSNKAGAKLLDSFRVKVRKQKGKKLARGKFSDNAKRPEQYMAGGPA